MWVHRTMKFHETKAFLCFYARFYEGHPITFLSSFLPISQFPSISFFSERFLWRRLFQLICVGDVAIELHLRGLLKLRAKLFTLIFNCAPFHWWKTCNCSYWQWRSGALKPSVHNSTINICSEPHVLPIVNKLTKSRLFLVRFFYSFFEKKIIESCKR